VLSQEGYSASSKKFYSKLVFANSLGRASVDEVGELESGYTDLAVCLQLYNTVHAVALYCNPCLFL
jgi:hypothetical protein